MPKTYYPDLAKLLRAAGYELSPGGKGSHEKWRHRESARIQIVPHNLKSRHTANGICVAIGLEKQF